MAVEIPKAHGAGVRILGVPTVADTVAQTVIDGPAGEGSGTEVPRRLLRAVRPAGRPWTRWENAERCWKHDWVVDLDIRKFFDSVPWDFIVKATEANTPADAWVILYVKRWLSAPLQMADGSLAKRDTRNPQGSAVSPVLANLFLHYAFDMSLARKFPAVPFERYVDDAVVHCRRRSRPG